ncbi:MAG: hypothetical protein H7832_04585 [Magnetococcus sp. DMHC-6]
MESIEVAKIRIGQTLTLEFGNKEAILTKMEGPQQFNLEEWYPEEEREIYILEDVIAEDEPLHYSFEPILDPTLDLESLKGTFGINRRVFDFLGRTVSSIETDEEEEEEEEEG